jgi:hypothetical protein
VTGKVQNLMQRAKRYKISNLLSLIKKFINAPIAIVIGAFSFYRDVDKSIFLNIITKANDHNFGSISHS